MRTINNIRPVIAVAVVCISLLCTGQVMAQGGGQFRVDSFFDVIYSVQIDATGGIGVRAVGVTHAGESKEESPQILRVVRAGAITKIYLSHAGEEAVTEIELSGDKPRVTDVRVSNPKKHTHRGHVTVLK